MYMEKILSEYEYFYHNRKGVAGNVLIHMIFRVIQQINLLWSGK